MTIKKKRIQMFQNEKSLIHFYVNYYYYYYYINYFELTFEKSNSKFIIVPSCFCLNSAQSFEVKHYVIPNYSSEK